MDDTISRKEALDAILGEPPDAHYPDWYASIIERLPSLAPLPHGRLIDADALLRMEQEQYEATIADNPNPWHRTLFESFHITFRDTIENAPTVVPEVDG